MRSRPFLPSRPALAPALLAAMLVAGMPPLPAAAQAAPGSLGDFRLPPDPDASAQQPAPQGPVAPDVPSSTRVLQPAPPPGATPAPAATPVPAPAPTASPVVQPIPTATPAARVIPPPPPAARPSTTGSADGLPAPSPAPEELAPASPAEGTALPTTAPLSLPRPDAPAPAQPANGGSPWPWIAAAALLALAAAGLIAWLLRRRTGARSPAATPRIERPSLAPAAPAAPPEPVAPPAASAPAAEPTTRPGLEVELEPLRLSLTLMNAALSYRLLLNNRGSEPLEGLSIAADMIAAHATLSREQQLSGPDATAMQVASIALLEPGESRLVSAEFRLPFSQIMPVRQGNAALLFPLARFRIEGADREAVTRTFLVAQPSERPGAGLQPFRLDLGPRIYPRLAQRAFA